MSIVDVLTSAIAEALLGLGIDPGAGNIHLERPARQEHGDFSTNIALVVAKASGRPPRVLAEELASSLSKLGIAHVQNVEIAGPGFINFHLAPTWLHDVLRDVVCQGPEYASPDIGHGERVQVEFVSANPTGPLHVGNGWLGSYGDALARLLSRTGHEVTREYYVNDTGNQIRMLGESVLARRSGEEVPEQGYQGDYVRELALAYQGPDDVVEAGRYAADLILANIKDTLERIGITYDSWYSQASIEESGKVAETIAELGKRGLVYEQDGATWLKSTELGDQRDRVLIKANGDATYLAGDLAYHRDKFLVRKFDRVIDVFGADHHGQVASLQAGVAALGVEKGRLEVELGQLVSLAGKKMSKRSGVYVRLDELVDEVGADATRLLSLLSSIDQATTLDLDILSAQSAENPVYYLQYAYTRIASIERVRASRGIDRPSIDACDLSVLAENRELAVLRCLAELPDVVQIATIERAPHKVTSWARRLAADFHGFYHDCRVLGDDIPTDVTYARLWLTEGTRIGLGIALFLLGVRALEEM